MVDRLLFCCRDQSKQMPIDPISRGSTSVKRLSSKSFEDPVKPRSMPTREITPCSTSSTSLQNVLGDAAPASPARSPGTSSTSTIIAIAVKAHEKLRLEPFAYAFNQLLQQQNCKVVVISCMSRVHSELGHYLMIDDSFGGISKKKLEATVNEQRNNLNHYLKAYGEELKKKGVELEIKIGVGRKSEDILVHEAKEVCPLWVVLDTSWTTFSGNQHKTIQAALPECNLVLLKNSKALIVHQTTRPWHPVEESHDQAQSEEPLSSSENSSSNSITPTVTSEVTPSSNPEITSTITTEAPSLTQSTPTITGETSSSNGTTPIITPETSSSNGTTPAIAAQETSSSNGAPGLSSSNGTTPTATAEISTSSGAPEMSSSNGTTPTITAEASSSNGTPRTMTTDTSVTVHNTTSTATSNTDSQSESGTSAQTSTPPSPPPSQVARPRRLKDIYSRLTSQVPLFPNLNMPLSRPLYNPPSSDSETSTPQTQANPRSPLRPTTRRPFGSITSTSRTPSPSSSVTSADQSNRTTKQNGQLKKIGKMLTASGRYPGLYPSDANPNTSLQQSDENSYSMALAIATEASIQSAIEEGIPVSPRTGQTLGSYSDSGSGSSSGLRISTGDIRRQSGSLQPTPSPSAGLTDNSSQSYAPSAPPLPLDGPIQYPSVDTSQVVVNSGYPGHSSGRCVICLDAPADAVCVPCGHIAGCKTCLTEASKWGCPLCRAKIERVLKVYHAV